MAICPRAGGDSSAAVTSRKMGAPPAFRGASFAIFLVVALATGAAPSRAAVYEVGDAAGWSHSGEPNYTAWAASKAFHLGDTIVFEYNRRLHNVMEVSKAEYDSCGSPRSPLAVHSTGNDSIALTRSGHRYFICGVPGHCALGQKLHVRIPKPHRPATAPAPSPSRSPASSPSPSPSPAIPSASSPRSRRNDGTITRGNPPASQENGANPRGATWMAAAAAMGAALANVVGF